MTTEKNHAISNARGHLESIRELMNALKNEGGVVDGEELDTDAIEERINEYPLSVQVREGWHNPGEAGELAEYEILLTTGGPALRIIGELGRYDEPSNARIEWQDWGTPWTELHGADMPEGLEPSEWDDLLLNFAGRFYYGAA